MNPATYVLYDNGNEGWTSSARTLPQSGAGGGTRRLRRSSRTVKIVIYFVQAIKLENCSAPDYIHTADTQNR
jgi:hypothetical protein